MKILLGTPYLTAIYDNGKYIMKALSELGHSIIVWDFRLNPKPPTDDYDFAIINKGDGVDVGLLSSPKIVFFPDDWHYYPVFLSIIKEYDHVFTLLKPDQDWMKWLPGFCCEDIHHKLDVEKKFDVGYIGTCNLETKAKFVVTLISKLPRNISFCIFGNNWEKVGINAYRPQYFQDYNIVCNYARLLLVAHPHNHGITRKAFEFTASGTPTLIDRVDGVDEIFGENEVIKYEHGNVEDCLEKIQYYLENISELEKVAKAGQKRAYQFTFKSQFKKVVDSLDNSGCNR